VLPDMLISGIIFKEGGMVLLFVKAVALPFELVMFWLLIGSILTSFVFLVLAKEKDIIKGILIVSVVCLIIFFIKGS